jgi:type VI secretion system protein ImpF
MSPQPQKIEGLRVPLFDRFIDSAPELRKEHTPLRVYGRAEISTSIARDLDRLLNTRRALPPASSALTVIDYGIPDFNHVSAADELECKRLAETIRLAIETFESRLEEPLVTIDPDPTDTRSLLVSITGRVRLGRHAEPVAFSVLEVLAVEPVSDDERERSSRQIHHG